MFENKTSLKSLSGNVVRMGEVTTLFLVTDIITDSCVLLIDMDNGMSKFFPDAWIHDDDVFGKILSFKSCLLTREVKDIPINKLMQDPKIKALRHKQDKIMCMRCQGGEDWQGTLCEECIAHLEKGKSA